MNLLNEICRIAGRRGRRAALLRTLLAPELSFYQNRREVIVNLREREAKFRFFSIPYYDQLSRQNVRKYFILSTEFYQRPAR